MTLYEVIVKYAEEKATNDQKAWQRKALEDMQQTGALDNSNKKATALMLAKLLPCNTWKNMLDILGFASARKEVYNSPTAFALKNEEVAKTIEVDPQKPEKAQIDFSVFKHEREKVAVK